MLKIIRPSPEIERPAFFQAKPSRFYYNFFSAQEDRAYELTMQDVGKISVYCQMSDAGLGECGGGGWTLVMKIDGSKVPC